jgi:hypothetical protein
MAELLLSMALDENQNITGIFFLNENGETFGRKTTKESPIMISAGSRLLAHLEELYQEYADGYETSHADALVTSIKIKWEGVNPTKCDLAIMARSTKFGSYSVPMSSPSTVHITDMAGLIQRISEAALKEYISYDKAVPAYEQPSLFQSTNPLPNLSMSEPVAA